jgi:hypothetical protein
MQSFGQITQEPGPDFDDGFFDGILGLAYPVIAMPLASFLPGPFDNMMTMGIFAKNIFSVFLSSVPTVRGTAIIAFLKSSISSKLQTIDLRGMSELSI